MSFEFTIPQGLIDDLRKCADIDKVAPTMLKEAAPILARSLGKALLPHRKTGGLIESIKPRAAKRSKSGVYYIKIEFYGYAERGTKEKKKTPHAQKAMALEYGTSKQNATPFMEKAKNDSEKEVVEKLQEVYTREVMK